MNKISGIMTTRCLFFIGLFYLCCPCLRAQTAAPANSVHCTIDKTPPTEADGLLAMEKYKEAEASYREVLSKSPANVDAQLGVVRALIGMNQVAEATSTAAAFLKDQPANGIAQVAVSEAAYRAGDVNGSFQHAKEALKLLPCDGRSSLAIARSYEITALYGKSARFKRQAHILRPADQTITREWISSLPRGQRMTELSAFLKSMPPLSEEESHNLKTELQYLQARKPSDCRVSSANEQTQTAMQPVYGDQSHPIAYGLDVSFDGKRRRMQIDTGASGIILTENAARGLGLQQEYHLKTAGVGDEGQRDSYLSHVHIMRIGEVELKDCMVEVVTKSRMGVDGLIGMNVFRRWLVTLDYQAAMVRLAPLPKRPENITEATKSDSVPREDVEEDETPKDRYVAPEMQDWLPVARIGHQILLPAVLKPGSPAHYMIMDTGAQMSTFSLPMAKEAGKLHSSSVEVHGISGKMNKVYETDRTHLYVGILNLAPESYYAFDLTNISHDLDFEISGLLGLPTLQRLVIQIDYRDNLLKLNYDPKHDIVRF